VLIGIRFKYHYGDTDFNTFSERRWKYTDRGSVNNEATTFTLKHLLPVRQISDSLTGEVGEERATFVGSVDRMGYFIVHRENIQLLGINVCNSNESSIASSSSDNESDSDLTDTSELAQPLVTWNDCLGSYFYRMHSIIICFTGVYVSLTHLTSRHIPGRAFQLENGQYDSVRFQNKNPKNTW
jgi:hypothetical protein